MPRLISELQDDNGNVHHATSQMLKVHPNWQDMRRVTGQLREAGNTGPSNAMWRHGSKSEAHRQEAFLEYCFGLARRGNLPQELEAVMTPEQRSRIPSDQPPPCTKSRLAEVEAELKEAKKTIQRLQDENQELRRIVWPPSPSSSGSTVMGYDDSD